MTNVNFYRFIASNGFKSFLRYLIVAIASAIVSYFSSSCTAGVVIGHSNKQYQEQGFDIKSDSSKFTPTLQIR